MFIIADSDDFMHEEYISQSDMGDFIIVDDDEDEVVEDGQRKDHLTKEEMENAMEVDDDEWETEDSGWVTDDEDDMISVEENDGPIITEITSDHELEEEKEDQSNKEMIEEKIKEEIKATLLEAKSNDKDSSELKSFILLEEPPENHHFIDYENTVINKRFYKTIMKEHKLLSSELPKGEIVVVAFSSRLELLRAIIFGPKDTIYEGIYNDNKE